MTEPHCPPVIKWCRHICGVCLSIGILVALAILGLVSYSLVFSETVVQDQPLTVERARQIGCPIPLPETATNVRFAIYRHWGEHDVYVKFKDDSTVCRNWADTAVSAYATENHEKAPKVELQRVTTAPATPSWGGVGPLRWFNIERIVDGATWSGGHDEPTIWVDDDHDLFFYRVTN